MSENCTAEDFAQAEFARHEDGRKAMRIGSDRGIFRWWVGKYGGATDEDMAAEGWVPVRVANGRRDRGTYIDHIADQDRVIRRRNDEIAVLRRELADAQAPLSLDDLEAAWETAEVPAAGNPAREGDVVIVRNDSGIGGYFVRPSHETHDFELEAEGNLRVLSRAPQREPWQDLADAFKTWDYPVRGYEEELAKWVYAKGVRVTGGDES